MAAHDVGKAINPTLVEGQIQGGIAQGLGLALMEEYLPGRTENLHDYLIPTVGDVPRDRVHPDRGSRAARPLRRQGRRRAGLVPTAPAILGAIHHATGVRASPACPLLPHRLRAVLDPPFAAQEERLQPGHERRSVALSDGRGEGAGIVRCDACPVLCRIRPGRAGACDRYANEDGKLVRVDPLVLLAKPRRWRAVAFLEGSAAWRGELRQGRGRLRHRHRRRHHLSRLQAGALHRLVEA